MEYASWLDEVRIGIESEALRLNRDGSLAATPHPFDDTSLSFTRDFAENQLEMVTPPSGGTFQAVVDLRALSDEAEATLAAGNEILWPMSMPPRIPSEAAIQLARFSDSETDRRKHLYRKGLASRFGTKRQLICGVHVNVSMGDAALKQLVADDGGDADARYLGAARHLYRRMESLVLLTGATPVAGEAFPFSRFNREPVVSVRNSNEGYADHLFDAYLDLSSVGNYVGGIRKGLRTALPAYRNKGLVKNGRLVQLSGSVFQSEKEFYAPIRLRQVTAPEESQTHALERRGIGYLEIRCIDRNPFEHGGVDSDALLLIHLLFMQGVLEPMDEWSPQKRDRCLVNARVAAETRLADLIEKRPTAQGLIERTKQSLASVAPLAEKLDRNLGIRRYESMLERQFRRIYSPERLLSAELFERFRKSGLGWTDFGLSLYHLTEKEETRELYNTGI